jgi:hypothetical protein
VVVVVTGVEVAVQLLRLPLGVQLHVVVVTVVEWPEVLVLVFG